MVREHHDQPGPDVSEWRSCGEHRVGSQRAELPTRARPVPPLHTQRPLDRHQHDLRRSHTHPSQETAQRFDQGERRSGTYYYYYINRLMASFISFPFALRKSDRMHQAARGNDAISPDLQGEGRWKYRCCCCCCCVVVWGMICGFDPSELIFLFFFFLVISSSLTTNSVFTSSHHYGNRCMLDHIIFRIQERNPRQRRTFSSKHFFPRNEVFWYREKNVFLSFFSSSSFSFSIIYYY